MMDLPKKCYVNRFIAKKTFYDKVGISNTVKDSFINEIEKITWLYKLAPDTLGIPKTENVEEIEIFQIDLRKKIIPYTIIKAITRCIPYKILFLLKYGDDYCYAIKIEEVYVLDWNENINIDLNVINIEVLFEKIVRSIIKEEYNEERLSDIIEHKNKINLLSKEIEKQKTRVKNEKQFDRKVDLNNTLNNMIKEMEELNNE